MTKLKRLAKWILAYCETALVRLAERILARCLAALGPTKTGCPYTDRIHELIDSGMSGGDAMTEMQNELCRKPSEVDAKEPALFTSPRQFDKTPTTAAITAITPTRITQP